MSHIIIDKESGQHYNYFRDYEPATGRYLESDPIGLEGGWNTYGYVLSNPLIFFDVEGTNNPLCLTGPIQFCGCVIIGLGASYYATRNNRSNNSLSLSSGGNKVVSITKARSFGKSCKKKKQCDDGDGFCRKEQKSILESKLSMENGLKMGIVKRKNFFSFVNDVQ